MRVFVDARVDPRVAELFPNHEVTTAFDFNWHTLPDHRLLPLLQGRFDVFVTADRGFEHEHNLKNLSFGIVIVHVPKNKVEFYRPLAEQLIAAITSVRPAQVTHVPA
jgi:hypothetical protein